MKDQERNKVIEKKARNRETEKRKLKGETKIENRQEWKKYEIERKIEMKDVKGTKRESLKKRMRKIKKKF